MTLAQRLRARDNHAMTELYERYGGLVFHIILRYVGDPGVAEDLAQETFLRIWNGARGFDESRGSLGSWISIVARNAAIDYLRSPSARAARTTVELNLAHRARRFSAFEDWILNFDRVRQLRAALEKLTDSQRLVLSLSYVEGMSHAEIARSLNRPRER